MTKVVYLDCPTGISGDMCLGALVDAGVPLDYLAEQLKRLGLAHEYHLRAKEVIHHGQRATQVQVELTHALPVQSVSRGDRDIPVNAQFQGDPDSHHSHHSSPPPSIPPASRSSQSGWDGDVNSPVVTETAQGTETPHAHHHHVAPAPNHAHSTRHLAEIETLIQAADLPERVTAWSLAIFRQLAIAEGAVHGIDPAQVHFHEVGATDALVDIVGTCIGLDWLDIDQLYCSALPIGGGTVWAAHGRLPVPAPAVLKLWELRQVPIYSNGIEREMVTPTGAAIATTLATGFGAPPPMTLMRVGLGAGSRSLPIPNILRLWIGESRGMVNAQTAVERSPGISPAMTGNGASSAPPTQSHPSVPVDAGARDGKLEAVAVLETQLDDLNPQAVGYLYDGLFDAGAVDVFTQAIAMKKSRPGLLLTVICPPERVPACEAMLFRETTTLGIRQVLCDRAVLPREFHTITVAEEPVRIKVARSQATGEILNVQPEYEDCARIAQKQHRPWYQVQQQAIAQWQGSRSDKL